MEVQPRETELEARVAKFISLICNISMMKQQMLEIGLLNDLVVFAYKRTTNRAYVLHLCSHSTHESSWLPYDWIVLLSF